MENCGPFFNWLATFCFFGLAICHAFQGLYGIPREPANKEIAEVRRDPPVQTESLDLSSKRPNPAHPKKAEALQCSPPRPSKSKPPSKRGEKHKRRRKPGN